MEKWIMYILMAFKKKNIMFLIKPTLWGFLVGYFIPLFRGILRGWDFSSQVKDFGSKSGPRESFPLEFSCQTAVKHHKTQRSLV